MFKSMVKSINDTVSEVNFKNGIVVMSIRSRLCWLCIL